MWLSGADVVLCKDDVFELIMWISEDDVIA